MSSLADTVNRFYPQSRIYFHSRNLSYPFGQGVIGSTDSRIGGGMQVSGFINLIDSATDDQCERICQIVSVSLDFPEAALSRPAFPGVRHTDAKDALFVVKYQDHKEQTQG